MSEKKKGGLFGLFKKKESPKKEEIPAVETVEEQSPDEVTTESELTPIESEQKIAELVIEETTEVVQDISDFAEPNTIESDDIEPEVVEVKEATQELEQLSEQPQEQQQESTQEKPKKESFFSRLKSGLSKTRSQLTSGLADLVLGSKQIDDDLFEEIETQLLMADVGVAATRKIIDDLTDKAGRKELKDSAALMERLRELLSEIVTPCSNALQINKKPFVILMVGVNGVGKTTTIGKLAKKFQNEGKSVMLAAGDTFRAAAVEQLQVWGERNNVHVTAQHTGADSASVVFDALQAAQARNIDVLIADTAGRLHTKSNLMDELEKVVRVMQKLDPEAPHETMLVVDAGTGQNALNQAEHFHKAVGLSGISITKLDGTAKGGVVFALADKLSIPIRFIGVGEGIDDLRPFDSQDFIEALFSKE
ncbi:signal recognition particle-docking protein FtsY [Kangiella sp. HZ709]|uniref:signal recognition particle-docking protein FtsY n=1 Tax=Kangiella sp. HZ709 TaxID=2666328 RepID=UPI0012AEE6CE|nr:signal recognition particle-docking protein FtsY [Kangiella sp. HZ709]MRX27855.1 signal recognition particle-docking protein FtsY [Kangiella sp. HZ709]